MGEQGQTAHTYTVFASLLAGSVQGEFIQVLLCLVCKVGLMEIVQDFED